MTGTRKTVRTGIDLGNTSVKLVRGVGNGHLERVTHIGLEPLPEGADPHDAALTSAALRRLLERLGLKTTALGQLAVAVGGPEVTCREVLTPSMNHETMARALPFEARKHLDLENMVAPVLDYQVLGESEETTATGGTQMRVLFAAAPRAVRDYPVEVLRLAGLEPDVVDLEPLAALNAVAAAEVGAGSEGQAVGLLDLGGQRAVLHLWSRSGGLLSRQVGAGSPAARPEDGGAAYGEALAASVLETSVFFRGRHRRPVVRLYLSGGGANLPGVRTALEHALDLPVIVFDPLLGLNIEASGCADASAGTSRFVTACGLCRWWDANS